MGNLFIGSLILVSLFGGDLYSCEPSVLQKFLDRVLRRDGNLPNRAIAPSALRKQKLSAAAARDEFDITDSWDMLPQLKTERLEEVTKFKPNSGTYENWFYEAKLKDKNVFIKTLDDMDDKFSEINILNEARHYYLMDMLGIGPKFHGVTRVNGKIGVVLEHVDGVLVKWGTQPLLHRSGIRIQESALRDMRLAAKRLDAAGIHNPQDMQFIISPDGKKATLVDPELFRQVGPENGARTAVEEVISSLKGYIDN